MQCVKEAVGVPVAIGSGLTPENLARYWPIADLFIVGSFVKQDGVWSNPIDAGRLGAFLDAVAAMREAKRVE